ncbi:MAG TPA: DNA-formamidopyrimidine glycosylase family protein, partial [Luteitalea sp.]|nr:DNA-formamidopyrimidine glycosylase family protein [Luteitalea sp.]
RRMPEGDTIFRAARTLQRALAGHRVTRFETQYAQLARVHDDAPIIGRVVDKVEARGKHLLVHFSASIVPPPESRDGKARPIDGPVVLRTHMLMSGSWHIYRVGERWMRSSLDARIVLGTDTFVAVGFAVPVAEFIVGQPADDDESIARLGPDLLSPEFDAAEAERRLATNGRPTVAEALLDQTALAGIGNVFKSELLFLARLWPFTPPADVTAAQWSKLVRDARVLLRANVLDPNETGVLTYRGHRRTTGRSNPAERVYVYGRQGRPCRRCGSAIALRHHGEHNRSTYWCPKCQAAPTAADAAAVTDGRGDAVPRAQPREHR